MTVSVAAHSRVSERSAATNPWAIYLAALAFWIVTRLLVLLHQGAWPWMNAFVVAAARGIVVGDWNEAVRPQLPAVLGVPLVLAGETEQQMVAVLYVLASLVQFAAFVVLARGVFPERYQEQTLALLLFLLLPFNHSIHHYRDMPVVLASAAIFLLAAHFIRALAAAPADLARDSAIGARDSAQRALASAATTDSARDSADLDLARDSAIGAPNSAQPALASAAASAVAARDSADLDLAPDSADLDLAPDSAPGARDSVPRGHEASADFAPNSADLDLARDSAAGAAESAPGARGSVPSARDSVAGARGSVPRAYESAARVPDSDLRTGDSADIDLTWDSAARAPDSASALGNSADIDVTRDLAARAPESAPAIGNLAPGARDSVLRAPESVPGRRDSAARAPDPTATSAFESTIQSFHISPPLARASFLAKRNEEASRGPSRGASHGQEKRHVRVTKTELADFGVVCAVMLLGIWSRIEVVTFVAILCAVSLAVLRRRAVRHVLLYGGAAIVVTVSLLVVYRIENVDLSQAWFYTAHTFLDSTPDSWLSPECQASPTENCREADGLGYFGPANLRAGVFALAMNHPLTTLAKSVRSGWDNAWVLLGTNFSTFPGVVPFIVLALALVKPARELIRQTPVAVWIVATAIAAESVLPPLTWAPPHPQYHVALVAPIVLVCVPVLVALLHMPRWRLVALGFLVAEAGLSAFRYTRYAGY